MKKIIIITLFGLILLPFFVSADLITPGYKPGCTRIIGLDKYPDVYVIGYVDVTLVGDKSERYIVKENRCLTKGYKFNSFKVLLAPKDYVDSVGIGNLELSRDTYSDTIDYNPIMKCYRDTSKKNSPCLNHKEDLATKEIFDKKISVLSSSIEPYAQGENIYKLEKLQDGTFVLKKSLGSTLETYWTSLKSDLIKFLVTFIIELMVVLMFLKKDINPRKIFLFTLIINLLTQPLANYLFSSRLFGYGTVYLFGIIELCVFIVEGILLSLVFKIKLKKGLWISFIANLLSALAGILLFIINIIGIRF